MPSHPPLTPELILWAYQRGAFPMADSRHGEVDWYSPDPRAILPLERFRVSRSLRRRVRRGEYAVTRDRAFEQVIRGCAEPRGGEGETWINEQIVAAYTALHEIGHAHSVEAWARGDDDAAEASEDEAGGELVGGLYGVSIGGAFFGESMFSRATDASKVCLVHLVRHLRRRGYSLLDVQINSAHMAQFGTVDIPRDEYFALLQDALRQDVQW